MSFAKSQPVRQLRQKWVIGDRVALSNQSPVLMFALS
jgi:hypothetical protein